MEQPILTQTSCEKERLALEEIDAELAHRQNSPRCEDTLKQAESRPPCEAPLKLQAEAESSADKGAAQSQGEKAESMWHLDECDKELSREHLQGVPGTIRPPLFSSPSATREATRTSTVKDYALDYTPIYSNEPPGPTGQIPNMPLTRAVSDGRTDARYRMGAPTPLSRAVSEGRTSALYCVGGIMVSDAGDVDAGMQKHGQELVGSSNPSRGSASNPNPRRGDPDEAAAPCASSLESNDGDPREAARLAGAPAGGERVELAQRQGSPTTNAILARMQAHRSPEAKDRSDAYCDADAGGAPWKPTDASDALLGSPCASEPIRSLQL